MASIVDERGFNQGFTLTPAQQLRLRRRALAIVEEMGPAARSPNTRLLEVGCGTGELALTLAQESAATITAVDLSEKFIAHARKVHRHDRLSFEVIDLRHSDKSPGAGYDFIVGNGILHHLYYRIDEFLRTMESQLARGGKLIFWEPNLANPYVFAIFSVSPLRKWANLEPDEMAFGRHWIRRRLMAGGFDQVSARPRDFLLPNTPEPLVPTIIRLGGIAEKFPVLRNLSQSLFISARRPPR